jgi:hypothetical protein
MDYGRLIWKEILYNISKVLDKEVVLLSNFDKLWGVRHVMCWRLDKKCFWSFQHFKAKIVG